MEAGAELDELRRHPPPPPFWVTLCLAFRRRPFNPRPLIFHLLFRVHKSSEI